LQILLEVTLALVLGRVAVPEADAFGSLAFLRVVREVLAARDAAGVGEAPFRLYRPEVRTSISGCVTPAGSTTSERNSCWSCRASSRTGRRAQTTAIRIPMLPA
jgi:hypothetical protein